jgi:hypothetical protein
MTAQTLQVIQRRFDGLVLALGVLAGQLVGGAIVTVAGWRWALLVNVPAGFALLSASYRALKTEPPGRGQALDALGVALLANAVAIATLGSLSLAGGLLWAVVGIAVVCAIAASTSARLTTSP